METFDSIPFILKFEIVANCLTENRFNQIDDKQ